MIWKNIEVQDGVVVNDKIGVYEGAWINDKRHGFGQFTEEETGIVYEGQWEDDMKNGKGALIQLNDNRQNSSDGDKIYDYFDRKFVQ